MSRLTTAEFDVRRRQLHEDYLVLLAAYKDELAKAFRRFKDADESPSFEDVAGGLRALGLGLARSAMPPELRDGDQPAGEAEAPPRKAGSRASRYRVVG